MTFLIHAFKWFTMLEVIGGNRFSSLKIFALQYYFFLFL